MRKFIAYGHEIRMNLYTYLEQALTVDNVIIIGRNVKKKFL